jgi:hypothetical protein
MFYHWATFQGPLKATSPPLFFPPFIIFTFTYMCIHCLCPLPPPLPSSGQNLFYPLLWFCWRDNIRDNKKDTAFLLVWDKDSSSEVPSIASRHLCIATHMVYHYQTSLLLLGPLPCYFKITLFTPQQGTHQPHSSFRFPFLSVFLPCEFSP